MTPAMVMVAVATAVVVVARAAFVVGNERFHLPSSFDRLGPAIAPVVTAALLGPRLAASGSADGGRLDVVAFVVAAAVAVRTRSLTLTLAVGMVAVWMGRALT